MRNTKLPGPDLKQRLKSGYSKSYLSFRGSFWFWLCCSFRGIMAASSGIKRCSAGFRSQSVSVPRPVRAEHWRPQWGTNLNQTRAGDMQSGSYQTAVQTSCMTSEHWCNKRVPHWTTQASFHHRLFFFLFPHKSHSSSSLTWVKGQWQLSVCSLRVDLNRHRGKIKDLLKICSAVH